MQVCARCARENPDEATFCMTCGSSLDAAPSRRETRKTVTLVFCDVTGSTALGEKLDPEALRRVMSRYFEAMREAIERHGGAVEKFIGDAVMAVFGIPQVHEDDALRAVRAAADMRDASDRLGKELERDHGLGFAVRIGVNTGGVVAGDPSTGQALVTGDPVNVAARLEQAAAPGEILIGDETFRLVRHSVQAERVEPVQAKGKSEGVPARRLLSVTHPAAPRPRRMDSTMVGRRRELDTLRAAYEWAVSDRACQLFTILAPAGTGKSRLLEEFTAALDGAAVLKGRCLPYGDGITYFPLIEIVKQAAGLADFDAPEVVEEKVRWVLAAEEHQEVVCTRVVQLLGVAEGGSPEETFWAARRFLEAVARRRPLVVVLDDVQWGEPTFLDLVEYVTEWSRDVPILIACMARPELLDARPTWAGGKQNASTISLEALSDRECERLIANLLGSADVPPEVSMRVVTGAEGNPLFVEEMLAMLVDDGLLIQEDGRWIPAGDLSGVAVPTTITALLAARLDRLTPDERRVLEAAAVIGQEFFFEAVRELVPAKLRDSTPKHVMALVRKDFVRPDRTTLPGQDALRFRHLLIRDAAYEGMPKELRAELHELAGDWLERVAGDRVAEQQEIVGHHLEQAYRYRTELNPTDTSAPTLAERAGVALAASGRRAYARGDMRATVNLLGRAAVLLPQAHPVRFELLPELSIAMAELGETEHAGRLLDEALATVDELADARTRAHLVLARWEIMTETGEAWREYEREAREALPVFRAANDDPGLASAWRALGAASWERGRVDAAVASWEQSCALAGRVGDRAGEASDRAWLLLALIQGSAHIEDARSRAVASLPLVEDVPAGKAQVLWSVALINALSGDFSQAHAALDESRWIDRELGRSLTATHMGSQIEDEILFVEGNREARARVLRQGLEAHRQMSGDLDPVLSASLAMALADLGDDEEAWELAQVAGTADRSGVNPDALRTEAVVLAHRGQFEEAEQRARDAVELMRATDFRLGTADTLMTLGEVLRLAGKASDAGTVIREALDIYETKGILPLAERARAALASL